MLDIGGTIECKFFRIRGSRVYHIYIESETLGIEPGETIKSNERLLETYRDHNYIESPWCLRLYLCVESINKRRRKFSETLVARSEFYNEVLKYNMRRTEKDEEWIIQNVKASIILPLIKEKSVIPNGLIYKDEYWRT